MHVPGMPEASNTFSEIVNCTPQYLGQFVVRLTTHISMSQVDAG